MIAVIAISGFVFAASCAAVRIFLGPGLADRVAALDVVLVSLMGGIVVWSAWADTTVYLNLLIVVAIVGFTATVATSRFIENKGGDDVGD